LSFNRVLNELNNTLFFKNLLAQDLNPRHHELIIPKIIFLIVIGISKSKYNIQKKPPGGGVGFQNSS